MELMGSHFHSSQRTVAIFSVMEFCAVTATQWPSEGTWQLKLYSPNRKEGDKRKSRAAWWRCLIYTH